MKSEPPKPLHGSRYAPEVQSVNAMLPDWIIESEADDVANSFNLVFREVFTGIISRTLTNEELKRSNWTYHSALAVLQTASIMDLQCDFESQGRLDGRIFTRKKETVLYAEWEWGIESIFANGAELEKLQIRTGSDSFSNCFLLSYCELSDAGKYFTKIARHWKELVEKMENPPRLYVHLCLSKDGLTHGISSAVIGVLPTGEPLYISWPFRGFAVLTLPPEFGHIKC